MEDPLVDNPDLICKNPELISKTKNDCLPLHFTFF